MNDNARKWVAALRSGEFKQGRHRLRRGDAYCCLGVASEVYRRETGRGEWRGSDFVCGADESQVVLTPDVRDWLGLRSLGVRLSNFNDRGATLPEIADIIEAEPKGLFR